MKVYDICTIYEHEKEMNMKVWETCKEHDTRNNMKEIKYSIKLVTINVIGCLCICFPTKRKA